MVEAKDVTTCDNDFVLGIGPLGDLQDGYLVVCGKVGTGSVSEAISFTLHINTPPRTLLTFKVDVLPQSIVVDAVNAKG